MKVTVTTSTEEDADTDDSVHLQLFGSKRNSNSPYLRLDTEANDFELGAVDVFNLSTPYIADIAYIKLKTGDDDGWLVKEVNIIHYPVYCRYDDIMNALLLHITALEWNPTMPR